LRPTVHLARRPTVKAALFSTAPRAGSSHDKTYLKCGGAMAGSGFVIVLVVYLLGFHSDPAKLSTGQIIQFVLGCAAGIACIVLGIKERRAATPPDQNFGYGHTLGTGVMITLFAACFGVLTNIVYMNFINPGMVEISMQAQIAKWEAAGTSSARIEQAEAMMRKMMSPVATAIFGFVFGMVFGTIISLTSGAFLKRPPADELQPVAGN
jgi:hypothetical protein